MILPFRRKKKRTQARAWKLPRVEVKDVFLFGGLAMAGYGVYQIYPPSAYILVGGCFVALGLLIYIGGTHERP